MTRILVVEDSVTMARMLQAIFESDGHTVRIHTDHFEWLLEPGRQVWDDIDMLVTDLNYGPAEPLSGLDVLRYAELRHPTVRRAVLSGMGGPEDEHPSPLYLAAAQIAMVLPKPTAFGDLLKAVR